MVNKYNEILSELEDGKEKNRIIELLKDISDEEYEAMLLALVLLNKETNGITKLSEDLISKLENDSKKLADSNEFEFGKMQTKLSKIESDFASKTKSMSSYESLVKLVKDLNTKVDDNNKMVKRSNEGIGKLFEILELQNKKINELQLKLNVNTNTPRELEKEVSEFDSVPHDSSEKPPIWENNYVIAAFCAACAIGALNYIL